VRFEATDGVELTGLLYEPERRARRAVVFLHGAAGASIFDSKRTNLLAEELVAGGFAFLPFNNRGAHLVRRLRAGRGRTSRSIAGGAAHEIIRECVRDIDGAARFLRRRGYGELYLAGHSTGANKIAVYDHYKPRNPFRKYVLLAGGDDTGGLYAQLGPRRFRAMLERSRDRIAAHRGDELAPAAAIAPMMSWRSLRDMINPDGDYNVFPFLEVLRGLRLSRKPRFRYVRAIRKPALFVYGDRDEFCFDDVPACVRILADALGPKPNAELVIMEDASHGFSGRERELGGLIGEWLLG
jgi:pimeloyl-ACP methyl ester carboxylesterase